MVLKIREFPRLKLFMPISRETGISREFPVRGFPLNIAAPASMGLAALHCIVCLLSFALLCMSCSCLLAAARMVALLLCMSLS